MWIYCTNKIKKVECWLRRKGGEEERGFKVAKKL
jgi:hypothetical protein